MERNVDKIKRLEKEIGRYQKKVADQAKENEKLRQSLKLAYVGNAQTQRAVDALMAQTAITYGEEVKDEETGAELGRSLTLPLFLIDDILARFEVHARRDKEKGLYVVGVVPREAEEAEGAE